MDKGARHKLHDDQTSECRSFGSNILPSSQSRKISIGVMEDSKGSTRCGTKKGNEPIVANTERVTSNVGNFGREKSKVQRVTTSFNTKKVEGPEEALKCSWVPKPFYQRAFNSEDILQPNHASAVGRDTPNGIECAAVKVPAQIFSKPNQTSNFTSSNDNHKKSDGETSRSKEKKDGNTERVQEFTFTTEKEVYESDKTKPEDKTTRSENSTENLRMKLCQILGTTSVPETQHAGSQTRNKGKVEERLPLEQAVNPKDNKFVKTRQYSDTIETDSENPDHTPKRPVTRSLTRKRMPSKKQPAKGKNGTSSKDPEDRPEKSILSFGEKWTGRQDTFPNDDSLMSLKKKGQGKNSKIGPHKTFTENDTGKRDTFPNDDSSMSLKKKGQGKNSKIGPHKTFTENDTGKRDTFPNDGSSMSLKKKGQGKNSKIGPHKTFFTENDSGKRDTFPNDGSSMSLKKKGMGKNSKNGPNKTCFTENDTADKLYRDTTKTDLPLHDGSTFSFGNKTGDFNGCIPDHQTKCPLTPKINQRKVYYQPPAVNNTDLHEEHEVSEKGNQQECKSDPIVHNVGKSQDNFQSPTFQLNTPASLSSSPSPTPKTDQKANDISSSVSTEIRFSLGAIRNSRTFQISEPDFDWSSEQKQSSDMEGLKYSFPRKESPLFNETEEQDGSSDSSSEEINFSGSQGSRIRHTDERKGFELHPVKRMRKLESIELNDRSPASVSSKGSEESDSLDEASQQTRDGSLRAVELFASELVKLKNKLKLMTSQKCSEVLKSVAEEIHLQLQNVHSQIQTDIEKLIGLSKSKRKRLETRFEDQQKKLRLIYDKFKEEINLHLQDCRSTVEGLHADQIEIKGALEKQRVAHKKLLSQVEEAVEMKVNDAQRKITATHEMARGKLLQLQHVIAMCLEDGIIS
ncbi:PREDICTED: uncharacterized protein LOC109346252 [Lupinus angustifolius]|uniref:uncharacterized protein LOC109346252 n=1 Tax=Lupinus angustifolius TaxID=3871 RepID=UPI00092E4D0D|nr:PREDICTED: uncharacterized protein LOC109346252 [Lupinus angustifolius]